MKRTPEWKHHVFSPVVARWTGKARTDRDKARTQVARVYFAGCPVGKLATTRLLRARFEERRALYARAMIGCNRKKTDVGFLSCKQPILRSNYYYPVFLVIEVTTDGGRDEGGCRRLA
jgi:hypothetical protein